MGGRLIRRRTSRRQGLRRINPPVLSEVAAERERIRAVLNGGHRFENARRASDPQSGQRPRITRGVGAGTVQRSPDEEALKQAAEFTGTAVAMGVAPVLGPLAPIVGLGVRTAIRSLVATPKHYPKTFTDDDKRKYLLGLLSKKKAGLAYGMGRKRLYLRKPAWDCLDAMIKAAAAAGHTITPFSGTRLHGAQKKIWQEKFSFTRAGTWGRLDTSAPPVTAHPTECKGLIGAKENEWNSGARSKRKRVHEKCWKALTDEEKAREILKTSSGPGFSRHHWGTEVDLNSDDPDKWQTDAKLKALYTWLKANAATYGYYQPYTSRAVRTGGYAEEKWHWSFWPIAAPLYEDYLRLIISDPTGKALFGKSLAGVAGEAVIKKVFQEYVKSINPILKSAKGQAEPACMKAATGGTTP